MEELVSAITFFLTGKWCRQFFRAAHAFFYSHSCCMIFLTVEALHEFFFSNLPLPLPPPPPKIKRSTPKKLIFPSEITRKLLFIQEILKENLLSRKGDFDLPSRLPHGEIVWHAHRKTA